MQTPANEEKTNRNSDCSHQNSGTTQKDGEHKERAVNVSPAINSHKNSIKSQVNPLCEELLIWHLHPEHTEWVSTVEVGDLTRESP